jgi:hypothetical protein
MLHKKFTAGWFLPKEDSKSFLTYNKVNSVLEPILFSNRENLNVLQAEKTWVTQLHRRDALTTPNSISIIQQRFSAVTHS